MMNLFMHGTFRLLVVSIPEQEASIMTVPWKRAVLFVRMDVHPRTSCIVVVSKDGGYQPEDTVYDRLGLYGETQAAFLDWLKTERLGRVSDAVKTNLSEVIRKHVCEDPLSGVPPEGTVAMLTYWVVGLLENPSATLSQG